MRNQEQWSRARELGGAFAGCRGAGGWREVMELQRWLSCAAHSFDVSRSKQASLDDDRGLRQNFRHQQTIDHSEQLLHIQRNEVEFDRAVQKELHRASQCCKRCGHTNLVKMAADWPKCLSFSDRLAATTKMQVSRSVRAARRFLLKQTLTLNQDRPHISNVTSVVPEPKHRSTPKPQRRRRGRGPRLRYGNSTIRLRPEG